MDWSPYSPDLTSCYFFLWDAFKDTVYWNHTSTLGELETLFCMALESISFQTLQDESVSFLVRFRHLCTAKIWSNCKYCLQRSCLFIHSVTSYINSSHSSSSSVLPISFLEHLVVFLLLFYGMYFEEQYIYFSIMRYKIIRNRNSEKKHYFV